MTSRRAAFVKAHRWVSMILLLWIVAECLTGALLVFDIEIDRLWNSGHFASTPGDIGINAATEVARDSRPGDLVRTVLVPGSRNSGIYQIFMVDAQAQNWLVHVDPGTGEVLTTSHQPPALMRLVDRLHVNLNSTSILGFGPLSVLGVMSIAFLGILLSGFYIWYWPGVRRWAQALRVRRSRTAFVFNLDLHRAVGIASLVPLLVVVGTAVDFSFPRPVLDAWNTVTFDTYEPADVTAQRSELSPGAAPITRQDAIDAVLHVDPNVVIRGVVAPGGSPVGVYSVIADVDPSFFKLAGGEHSVSFVVDQYSGAVIGVEDRTDANLSTVMYNEWFPRLHFGTFGGTTSRTAWVLLGVAPLLLSITGVRMWWIRRSKRRRRTDRILDMSQPDHAMNEGSP